MKNKIEDVINTDMKLCDRWMYRGKEYLCALLFPSTQKHPFIIFIIGEVGGSGTAYFLDDFTTTWHDGVVKWVETRNDPFSLRF